MGFFAKLKEVLYLSNIDDDFYDELEETLITADIGVETTQRIIEDLKATVKEYNLVRPQDCTKYLKQSLKKQMSVAAEDYAFEERTSVLLVVGVNGVGKTTSIGKLAARYKAEGRRVLLAAADTFRAGAIQQLQEWARRAEVDIICQSEGSDPAAVVFDAAAAAKARHTDILICDTAGRLHNKKNLMEELKKMRRILEREFPEACQETLVVVDAATGQNALVQAREFMNAAQVDGVILTKMDGTARGGIAVAIQSELKIPVKYIGTGEKISDLKRFNADEYVESLFAES